MALKLIHHLPIKHIKYKHIDGSSEKLDAETYQKELNSDDFGTVGAAQDSHICPKPTQIINSGNTIIYWSYNDTVHLFDYLSANSSSDSVSISGGAIGFSFSFSNTSLRTEADQVTDDGFGLAIKLSGGQQAKNGWYCNDSWPNASAACFVKATPSQWDHTHVSHFTELGVITTAFYGGWSCDYNGTANGATWAGVGKGHK